MSALSDHLAEYGIYLPNYAAGDHRSTCARCSAQRKKKDDQCLSLKIDADGDGAAWHCWHCGWADGIRLRDHDHLIPNGKDFDADAGDARTTASAKPKPDAPEPFDEALLGTQPPPNFYKWFQRRGIGAATLTLANVRLCSHRIRDKGEVPCIAFPYYRDNKLVNVKFRDRDKNFAMLKGWPLGLYLRDLCDPGYGDHLVIVEGEIDALSCLEAAIHNAVSVPCGGGRKNVGTFLDPERDLLDQYSKIVIATDADEKGRELATALLAYFGAVRCSMVAWPPDCNDANEVLVKHSAEMLRTLIQDAKPCQQQDEPQAAAEAAAGDHRAKPDLVVNRSDLTTTAYALRNHFAAARSFFDRGVLVKLANSAHGGMPVATRVTVDHVVVEAHRVCQPVVFNRKGECIPVTLPERVARLYLALHGEWHLPALAGISTAPMLEADGAIRLTEGYDPAAQVWCMASTPDLRVPEQPQRGEAANALLRLRDAFKTFPFADAKLEPGSEIDINKPPGLDESAFLNGLLTAVCRPSLWLAPGLLLKAAAISGSGTGKGLLVRAICAIAFGISPSAFTGGRDPRELEKRIASALLDARPAVFLDNVNAATLKSDLLASVLSERPASMRILGESRMVEMNSAAFIIVTGNGLVVSEDLARRFIIAELKVEGCEDPEAREFDEGFLERIEGRRAELLAAALTIWRWGRQNVASLKRGRSLGGYERWAKWVRDPLLAFGCRDPVERIGSVKASDPHRRQIAEIFQTWDEHHGNAPVKIAKLADPVRDAIDPQGRGRQYVATFLTSITGTQLAGFTLLRQDPIGRWGAATYTLAHT